MSKAYAFHRYLTVLIICTVLFATGGCIKGHGPVKLDNILSPTILIAGLKNLEYRSILPVRITIESSGKTIVTLAMAFRVGESGAFTIPSSLAGKFNPASLQQILVPSGGTELIFWWHAIADLEAGQRYYPVYIKATIITADGRMSEFTFGPITIDLTDTLGGALPPYVPDTELPPGQCGEYYQVQLPVIGGHPPFVWSIEPDGTHLPYVLELTYDGIIRGQIPDGYGPINLSFDASALDSNPVFPRESAGHFTLFVDCDQGTTPCGPAPEILFDALPVANEGETYLFQATAAGGFAPMTWEIAAGSLPDGIIFDPTGLFSGTPDIGTAGDYPLTIQVTDSCPDGARIDTVEATLTVEGGIPGCDPGPSIITQTLPGGKEGTAYDAPITAQGGHGNLTWSLETGALPGGINVTANGHILGTPAAGTGGSAGESYTFTVRVCDSCPLGEQCDSQQLVLLIAPPDAGCDPPPVIVNESPLNPGTEGVAYLYQFLATGGHGVKTWVINNPDELPDGLDFNNQGKLSGTPAVGSAGVYNLDISVNDSCPDVQSDLGIFELTINASPCASPPVITTTTVDEGEEGAPYDFQFEATGGEGMLTWLLIGGDPLPIGLLLDTDGRLHGTPAIGTVNTYSIEVEVSDECPGAAQTDSNLFNLVINLPGCADPPTIVNTELAPALEETEYEQILTAQDGEGILTWELLLDGDDLPAGLTMTGNVISGTPDPGSQGTYNLHIQVCDSCPTVQCADEFFDLNVYLPCGIGPTVSTTSPIDPAIVGTPYSFLLEATGGEGALIWSVLSGGDQLPAGLSLVGNEITGTPDTGTDGTYLILFEVCDSCPIPQCDQEFLSLSVGATPCASGPVITTTSPLPDAIVGVHYAQQFVATGGEGAIMWSTVNLLLPPGFSLSQDGILEGDPTAGAVGTYNFNVTAADSCWSGSQTDVQPFSLTIDYAGCAPAPLIMNTPTLEIPAGSIVDLVLFAQDGEGALTWSLENIDTPLPVGITLDPTGRLTGPTDISDFGIYTFDIRVCDECTDPGIQCDVLIDFALTLLESSGCTNPPPQIIDLVVPEPIPDDTPYSYTMSASDGDTPIFWYGTGFPPGIDINPATGEISGSTTELGIFTIYIGVFDSCGPIPQADSKMYVWDLS